MSAPQSAVAGIPLGIVLRSTIGAAGVTALFCSETLVEVTGTVLVLVIKILALCHLIDFVYRHRHTLFKPLQAQVPQVGNVLNWTRKMDGTQLREGTNLDLGWPLPKNEVEGTSPVRPTVLITGASRGLGKEMAQRYHAMGYNLILWATNAECLGAVAAELESVKTTPGAGWAPQTIKTDIVDVGDADAVARKTGALGHGSVDLLILNAGIVGGKAVTDSTAEEVERVYRTNVFQQFNLCRALVPLMMEKGVERRIVVLGSIAGFGGVAKMAEYAGSKAAVNIFAESLSCELTGTNVSVTLVCPNVVNTGMFPGFKPMPIFPILDQTSVVDTIIEAVQYRKRWVVIPWTILVLAIAKYVLPWGAIPWADWLLGCSHAMDKFSGSKRNTDKEKRA